MPEKTISYISEISEEARQANQEYKDALARLTQALQSRQYTDPMLEIAKGFQSTGSFFGGLGNVAANLQAFRAGQTKEEQDIAAKEVEMAQAKIQLQRQREQDRLYRQEMGREPPSGALPSVQPAGPQGGALPGPTAPQGGVAPVGVAGESGPRGIQIAPPQLGMTKQQFLAGAMASNVPYHEALKQWDEIERKGREPKEGGIFDIRSGQFYPAPGGGVEERQVPLPDGTIGTIKFPKYIANQLDDAVLRGDMATFNNIVRQFLNYGRGAPAAPSAAAAPSGATPGAPAGAEQAPAAPAAPAGGAPAGPGRVQTVEEQQQEARRRDIAKAGAEEEARGISKGAVEYFDKAGVAADQSQSLFSAAESMISLINAQPKAFQLLSKPGIANAVLRAAEEGLRIGNFGSISIPSAQLASFNLNQQQLDALNLYANQLATAKSANRQMVRVPGEGTTSDLETNMANAVLTMPNASPKALKFINEFTMLRARNAELRFEKLNELRAKGMSLADARASQEMRDIRAGYENALRGLAQRNAELLATAKKSSKAAPKAPQKPQSENSQRLDDALRD